CDAPWRPSSEGRPHFAGARPTVRWSNAICLGVLVGVPGGVPKVSRRSGPTDQVPTVTDRLVDAVRERRLSAAVRLSRQVTRLSAATVSGDRRTAGRGVPG